MLFSLPIATMFFLVGLGFLIYADYGWWGFAIPAVVLGGFGALGSLTIPSARLVVDCHGITQRTWLAWSHVPWESIEAWLASPTDVTPALEQKVWEKFYPSRVDSFRSTGLETSGTFTGAVVLLRRKGWRILFDIDNYLDWQPSFKDFVAAVRAWIPDKEIVIPELQLENENNNIAETKSASAT
jgi:hypothetical protein